MTDLKELMESYISGNFSWVRNKIRQTGEPSFVELFTYFNENYEPSLEELGLFAKRLN